MAEDDFPEDFDDAFPEDEEPQAPAPKQQVPVRKAATPPSQQQQARRQAPPQRQTVQAPASAPVQTPPDIRFVPFILPPRNGVFDNQTGRPYMEDAEKLDLIIGLLTDHTNRLDRIEQGL
jgi:hypothetical protein